MKITIDLSNKLLIQLKALVSEISKYSFLVLSKNEEATFNTLMDIVFAEVKKQEQYESNKRENKEKVCKCSHRVYDHSIVGDRICCSMGCLCLAFTEMPQNG
jgi:hypothetical protein